MTSRAVAQRAQLICDRRGELAALVGPDDVGNAAIDLLRAADHDETSLTYLPWSEPPDPLGPDHPPAPRPEPLPWPDEPDWKRPVEIRCELEDHPAWPGWWQERGRIAAVG
jgi:hypothetical protein